MSVKGFKGFDKDLRCRGFQYEVGRTYELDGELSMCESGFHFCERLLDVHDHYSLRDSRVCEVEALGEVLKGEGKSVTNKIKIVRELTFEDILSLANTGAGNTGVGNSGSCNSGHYNSGGCNSGDRNSGEGNSGDHNSGGRKSGR
jgi:hypothetical protein